MRVFDLGGTEPRVPSDRVLTIPNLLSLARLVALPLLYLDLVGERFGRALVLLIVFASTDWLDGYLARRLDQVSRLGILLDPLSDRLFMMTVGVGFVVADLLPWWALALVVVRDVVVLLVGGVLMARGAQPPAVTNLAKLATFGLMASFPGFLIAALAGEGASAPQPALQVASWVLFTVHVALYYVAAAGYARDLLGAER